jgi:hypothetical protein
MGAARNGPFDPNEPSQRRVETIANKFARGIRQIDGAGHLLYSLTSSLPVNFGKLI